MRSASFAEWIIARFTTKARASSIIGDLLEAVPEKGNLWFWLSVAGVFFSLTWRPALCPRRHVLSLEIPLAGHCYREGAVAV